MLNVKWKIDDGDLQELIKRYPEVSREVRASKLEEAGLFLQRQIQKRTPEGVGYPVHLRSSIGFVGVKYGEKITIGTPINYAEAVEYGSKPHFPPWLDSLKVWVERKLGVDSSKSASVAFLIARKISKEGTKGAHMFEEGFKMSEPIIKKMLNEIPNEITRRIDKA